MQRAAEERQTLRRRSASHQNLLLELPERQLQLADAGVEPDQVGGEVDEVGVVPVDEVDHGGAQHLEVHAQVCAQTLQTRLLPVAQHETVHTELILPARRRGDGGQNKFCQPATVVVCDVICSYIIMMNVNMMYYCRNTKKNMINTSK